MRRRALVWFLMGFAAGALAVLLVLWFTTGLGTRGPAGALPEGTGGAHRSEPEPLPDPYPLTRPETLPPPQRR